MAQPIASPFFNQSAETADKVNAHFFGGLIEHAAGRHHLITAEARADSADRAHGNALIDDGDAVAVADEITGLNEFFGIAENLRTHFVGESIEVRTRAVKKIDAHRDGADVEMLRTKHIDGGKYLAVSQHVLSLSEKNLEWVAVA